MILHLLFDDKFTDYVINQFLPYNNSTFLLVKSSEEEAIRHSRMQEHLTVIVNQSDEYHCFLKSLEKFSAIIVHGLYTPWQVEIIEKAPTTVKIAWMFWGGEIYQRLDIRMSFLGPHTKFWVKLREIIKHHRDDAYYAPLGVFSKVDYVLTSERVEFELAKQYCPDNHFQMLYYSYYSTEDTIGSSLQDAFAQDGNIMVAHCAGERCNILEGFWSVKRSNYRGRKIITPLSYGPKWYANLVQKYGKILFGDSFEPLLKFMPREEYNKVLLNCSALVLPTYKPEAMGNCITALWLGARLYMYKRNIQYKHLVDMGLLVYAIDDIKNGEFDFSPMPPEKVLRNREILLKYYGKQAMKTHIDNLVNTLEE